MFNVSKEIYNSVKQGNLKAEELVLRKIPTANGRVWQIQRLNDSNETIHLKGPELIDLMKKAANSHSLPESFSELGKNQRFRVFSKVVPGLETEEHRNAVKSTLSTKIKHVKSTLRLVGWGISELKHKGQPFRSIQSEYVIAELTHTKKFTTNELMSMRQAWNESRSSLSFRAWIQNAQKSWASSGTAAPFLPWLLKTHHETLEHNAWKSSGTNKSLMEWRQQQVNSNPVLAEPEWYMRFKWSQDQQHSKSPISYENWLDKVIQERRQFWIDQPKDTEGLINFKEFNDQLFQKFEKLIFKYEQSGSSLNHDVWIARELWKESNPPILSDEEFIKHLALLKHNYQLQKPILEQLEKAKQKLELAEKSYAITPKNVSGRIRRAYLSNQIYEHRHQIKRYEKELSKLYESKLVDSPQNHEREEQLQKWKISHSTLSFEDWSKHQVVDPLNPHIFVKLGPKERTAYQTHCVDGVLMRGQNIYQTAKEETAHSGKGWVIFVIGPKEDLYCGSHLRSVFHHSSFLSDASIMGAGELKTDESGKITHISSKSGHYKPTHKENRAMLKWFEDRGVDLSNVTFTCFLKKGRVSKPINAKHYLNSLKVH